MAFGGAPAGLGLRAIRGGAVMVAVVLEKDAPGVVLSSFLATAAEGDRLAFEPYTVAAEMDCRPGGGDLDAIKAAVTEARARQDALAAAGLKAATDLCARRDLIPSLRRC